MTLDLSKYFQTRVIWKRREFSRCLPCLCRNSGNIEARVTRLHFSCDFRVEQIWLSVESSKFQARRPPKLRAPAHSSNLLNQPLKSMRPTTTDILTSNPTDIFDYHKGVFHNYQPAQVWSWALGGKRAKGRWRIEYDAQPTTSTSLRRRTTLRTLKTRTNRPVTQLYDSHELFTNYTIMNSRLQKL